MLSSTLPLGSSAAQQFIFEWFNLFEGLVVPETKVWVVQTIRQIHGGPRCGETNLFNTLTIQVGRWEEPGEALQRCSGPNTFKHSKDYHGCNLDI
jgi:hypothetical protein